MIINDGFIATIREVHSLKLFRMTKKYFYSLKTTLKIILIRNFKFYDYTGHVYIQFRYVWYAFKKKTKFDLA